jgi:small subunit ribosomal protein S17
MSENENVQDSGSDNGRARRKVRIGVVVSDKGDKTVVVKVERRLAHPLYGKAVARSTRYHAHDENNEYKVGDTVRITETRPLSKTKRWRVVGLLDRQA